MPCIVCRFTWPVNSVRRRRAEVGVVGVRSQAGMNPPAGPRPPGTAAVSVTRSLLRPARYWLEGVRRLPAGSGNNSARHRLGPWPRRRPPPGYVADFFAGFFLTGFFLGAGAVLGR